MVLATCQCYLHVHKHHVLKVERCISIGGGTALGQMARCIDPDNLTRVIWRCFQGCLLQVVRYAVQIGRILGTRLSCSIRSDADLSEPASISVYESSSEIASC